MNGNVGQWYFYYSGYGRNRSGCHHDCAEKMEIYDKYNVVYDAGTDDWNDSYTTVKEEENVWIS